MYYRQKFIGINIHFHEIQFTIDFFNKELLHPLFQWFNKTCRDASKIKLIKMEGELSHLDLNAYPC